MAAVKTPPWITEGRKVLGLHEVHDHEKLAAWLRSEGRALGDPRKLPWCGDFVDTAISLSLPDEPRRGPLKENPYWALNWQHFGVATPPVLWAVGVFVREGGGHVGFLIGQNSTKYRVFGGNQSNTVSESTWIDKRQLRAARWPLTYPNPMVKLPVLKADGTPASSSDLA